MSNKAQNRVLGRVLARDLTDRETETVGGATHGGSCRYDEFLSDILGDGTIICDPCVGAGGGF